MELPVFMGIGGYLGRGTLVPRQLGVVGLLPLDSHGEQADHAKFVLSGIFLNSSAVDGFSGYHSSLVAIFIEM